MIDVPCKGHHVRVDEVPVSSEFIVGDDVILTTMYEDTGGLTEDLNTLKLDIDLVVIEVVVFNQNSLPNLVHEIKFNLKSLRGVQSLNLAVEILIVVFPFRYSEASCTEVTILNKDSALKSWHVDQSTLLPTEAKILCLIPACPHLCSHTFCQMEGEGTA